MWLVGGWGCVVGGMHGWGHAWLLGSMRGCWGAYVIARGVHGCWWGACMVVGGGHA